MSDIETFTECVNESFAELLAVASSTLEMEPADE